ncbi:Cu2+-exporting ATPase [Flavobacteriaceae bacterium MAR_2010_188]|nr:Cu2+-exporting ATPase [Flavobacteriaceae bacterium MAR_2010_188]
MTHKYQISGMTCNGCKSHVEETLSKVEGVTSASVDLEKKEASIQMDSHIPFETFKKALEEEGGAYSIHKQGEVLEEPKKK